MIYKLLFKYLQIMIEYLNKQLQIIWFLGFFVDK